jgi:hypothetical protein
MADLQHDPLSELNAKLADLKQALARSKAVNVNAQSIKDVAKDVVQFYFRQCKPELLILGFDDQALGSLDDEMQVILRLSNGNNKKSYYASSVRTVGKRLLEIEAARENLLSRAAAARARNTLKTSPLDQAVLNTLQQLVPTAALSYEQACRDLQEQARLSFRGTANELRECLREVLDHFAPDKEVESQPGFKFEGDQKKPTMRQKVRFILRARGQPSTATETTELAIGHAEESLSRLTRSVYQRSSISAHVTTTKTEVLQMKMYVDGVLAELLQVHRNG